MAVRTEAKVSRDPIRCGKKEEKNKQNKVNKKAARNYREFVLLVGILVDSQLLLSPDVQHRVY